MRDCTFRFGEKKGKVVIIPLPLTHQRISEFVGAFRETVTIAIKKLTKERVISVDKSIISVLNFKKLEKFSKIEDNL